MPLLAVLTVSAKMMVHAVVSSDYPNTPPLLVVCINWKMQRHSLNDENIRVSLRSISPLFSINFLNLLCLT